MNDVLTGDQGASSSRQVQPRPTVAKVTVNGASYQSLTNFFKIDPATSKAANPPAKIQKSTGKAKSGRRKSKASFDVTVTTVSLKLTSRSVSAVS